MNEGTDFKLSQHLPSSIGKLGNHQTDLPRIARDPKLTSLIEQAVRGVPTTHTLRLGDARDMSSVPDDSVHLVLTSPPYWTLKEYRRTRGQLGYVEDYEEFLSELDKAWRGSRGKYREPVPELAFERFVRSLIGYLQANA